MEYRCLPKPVFNLCVLIEIPVEHAKAQMSIEFLCLSLNFLRHWIRSIIRRYRYRSTRTVHLIVQSLLWP
jgi:hypothetical protein